MVTVSSVRNIGKEADVQRNYSTSIRSSLEESDLETQVSLVPKQPLPAPLRNISYCLRRRDF